MAHAHAVIADDVVVSVRDVSKKFCKHLRRSMAYGIADLSKNVVGIRPDSSRLRREEFWAVDGVSLELRRGESVGLIGINGSGKTTLLRLIAGIFPPDKGEIAIRGRVGALIALGAGFHPYMTGRENIYLNGSILGISRREVEEKFQRIVDFAEIGDFIEAPVSTYSSGMRVRLGFSIAMHVEPDVMLVDEVLAVGDSAFRLKCMKAMRNMVDGGASIILVSHNINQVMNICGRTIWLEQGKVHRSGESEEVCQDYERFLLLSKEEQRAGPLLSEEPEDVAITDVAVVSGAYGEASSLPADEPIRLRLRIRCRKVPDQLYLRFGLRSVAQLLYYGERRELTGDVTSPGSYTVEVTVPAGTLLPGGHFLDCGLSRDAAWGSALQHITQTTALLIGGSRGHKGGVVDLQPEVTIWKSDSS